MKTLIGLSLFVIVGFISAFIIGFNPDQTDSKMAFDDEQSGIKDQIVIKFSHVVAENTPKGFAAQRFAELVGRKTDNRVKVEVFPNGILFSDKEELEALKDGKVQMIAPATSKLTSLFPKWQALDLPFAFPTHEAVEEALNGDIGKTLLDELKDEHIKGMAFWANGFKQMTSNRNALIKPNDFKDQSFRIMPSNVIEAQFAAFNATTERMTFNQTYHALEKGQIDGQENTLSNIYSKRLYDIQNYMTISNHGYLGYAVLMNESFWDRLPEDIQVAISESMDEATHWNQQNARQINEQKLDIIKENSDIKTHFLTLEEKREWINQVEPVYEKYEDIIGNQLMKEIRKIRDKYTQ